MNKCKITFCGLLFLCLPLIISCEKNVAKVYRELTTLLKKNSTWYSKLPRLKPTMNWWFYTCAPSVWTTESAGNLFCVACNLHATFYFLISHLQTDTIFTPLFSSDYRKKPIPIIVLLCEYFFCNLWAVATLPFYHSLKNRSLWKKSSAAALLFCGWLLTMNQETG